MGNDVYDFRVKPRTEMFDQHRAAAQAEPSREELFAERYELLLGWALHLTHQEREAAEDLVQDAFVQLANPRFGEAHDRADLVERQSAPIAQLDDPAVADR